MRLRNISFVADYLMCAAAFVIVVTVMLFARGDWRPGSPGKGESTAVAFGRLDAAAPRAAQPDQGR
jgi:hypothetical protein